MTNDWQNNSDAHTLVLGVFNFIYLMVTVITLLPSSYINEQNFLITNMALQMYYVLWDYFTHLLKKYFHRSIIIAKKWLK